MRMRMRTRQCVNDMKPAFYNLIHFLIIVLYLRLEKKKNKKIGLLLAKEFEYILISFYIDIHSNIVFGHMSPP